MKVGQKVWMRGIGNNRNLGVVEGEVTKVGRKYFDVAEIRKDGWKFSTQFHIDSLMNVTQYSSCWQVYFNQQDILDEDEKSQLLKDIREAFNYYNTDKAFTLSQLRKVKSILDGEK